MARAIDWEEERKTLKNELEMIGVNAEYADFEAGVVHGIEYCINRLDLAPTLTPPNEWVSVEERLPEGHAQVLMWSAKWNIAEAGSYYNKHFWVYSEIGDGYLAEDITYWMLLPAPPDRRPPERQEDT